MDTCVVSKTHTYELIDAGLVYFEEGYFTIVGLTIDTQELCLDTVESILSECDANPLRSHWRGHLQAQEEKSKPINVGSWRLAVLNKWLNGVSTPKKHENKRIQAHANTIAKIDLMAKYMMEQAADAPKKTVASLTERQLMEIE